MPTSIAAPPRAGETKPALLMIDGVGTRDRDDAFAVTRTRSSWQVEVHVANVADLVPRAGRADARALIRRASSYRPGGTIAMLGLA